MKRLEERAAPVHKAAASTSTKPATAPKDEKQPVTRRGTKLGLGAAAAALTLAAAVGASA